MPKSLSEIFEDCNNFNLERDGKDLAVFSLSLNDDVSGTPIGLLRPEVAHVLELETEAERVQEAFDGQAPYDIKKDSEGRIVKVAFAKHINSPTARSNVINRTSDRMRASVNDAFRKKKTYPGESAKDQEQMNKFKDVMGIATNRDGKEIDQWRNEHYAVYDHPYHDLSNSVTGPVFKIPRCSAVIFGTPSFGVHLTLFQVEEVQEGGSKKTITKFWVSKRSKKKKETCVFGAFISSSDSYAPFLDGQENMTAPLVAAWETSPKVLGQR